jgi:uncharacterized protein (DUF362 family)
MRGEGMMSSIVAIVKKDQIPDSPGQPSQERIERIKEMIKEGIDLCGGMGQFVRPGDKVFIKPNLFSPQDPNLGTVTDPSVVGALISLVREAGARRVYVGENPALVKSRVAFAKSGTQSIVEKYGGECAYLDEEVYIECLNCEAKVLGRVHLPKKLLDSDVFISVPKIKTHLMTLLTLGIKNSLGLLKEEDRRLRFHSESLHYKLVDLLYHRKPDLVIEDGIVAAEGQGPVCPEPVKMNLLVLSSDVVAADAVASLITGFEPQEVTETRLAGALGLGNSHLEGIEIKGAALSSVKRVFKRAIYSPIGYSPNIEVFAGGACVPCMGILRSALEQCKMEGILEIAEKCTFLIGTNPPVPERLREQVVIVGDCAEKYKDLGIFVPGCPPVPGLKILKALGYSPEWAKSFFEKE